MKRPTEGREQQRVEMGEGGERKNKYSNQNTNKIIFFFLALSYSTHLKIDVYCSGEAKIFAYSSTAATLFCGQ